MKKSQLEALGDSWLNFVSDLLSCAGMLGSPAHHPLQFFLELVEHFEQVLVGQEQPCHDHDALC